MCFDERLTKLDGGREAQLIKSVFINTAGIVHLNETEVFQPHVTAQWYGDHHTQQHHTFLFPRCALVLQGLLGVGRGSSRVLIGRLDVNVYPGTDHNVSLW